MQVLGALLLLIAITVVVVERPIRRYLVVGWLWFLGTLVPMIGLVQVGGQAMADRYAYLSFIGLFIMICWGVAEWAGQHHFAGARLAAASVVVLVALTVLTHLQLRYWSDNVTLWSHTLQITTNNFIAENSLGVALKREGRIEEAIPHFRAAVAIYPLDAASNINLAEYDRQHGHLSEAIERYKKVTMTARNNRQKAEAFAGLSEAYAALGDSYHARESLQAAQELQRGR
jgi:tetratricopeptide (TPR) repeat protein